MEENKGLSTVSIQEENEFRELISKIDKRNPDPEDVRKAEDLVRSNHHLWKIGMGIAGSTLKMFLDKITTSKSEQLLLEAEALSLKESLGYSSCNTIEKLAIEQIMFCWAGMNYMEIKVSAIMVNGEYDRQCGEYWQNTLTRYQNRYLKAIETLARIRKLSKSIALQVNIATDGGQQVNVGEVKKDG